MSAGTVTVVPSLVWLKLAAFSDGAAIATKRLFG
jgi:hypothetical protein